MITPPLARRLCGRMATSRYAFNRIRRNTVWQSHSSAEIATPVYSQTSVTNIRREQLRLSGKFDVEAQGRTRLVRRCFNIKIIARISNDVDTNRCKTDAM